MKNPIKIKGDGSSLRGNSKKQFKIENFEIIYSHKDDKNNTYFLSVDAYGKDLAWDTFTDGKIEKDIVPHVSKFLLENGYRLTKLSWSELGLQNNGTWNFDVKAVKKGSKNMKSTLKKEASHSKMDVEKALQFAEDFCKFEAFELDLWREPLTVLAAEVIRLRQNEKYGNC